VEHFNCIREAAEHAGVSACTISTWISDGALKCERINRTRVRIDPSDVDEAKRTIGNRRKLRVGLLRDYNDQVRKAKDDARD